MSDLIVPGGGNPPGPASGQQDPFKVAFARALPTITAVRELAPALRWLDSKEGESNRLSLPTRKRDIEPQHRHEALRRYQLVPDFDRLDVMCNLFHAAEHEPASEAWLHVAIGLMLDSMPNAKNVSPSYRFSVVDSMLYDEKVFEDYRPGFSQAVMYRTIQDVRRTSEYAPTPAVFLEKCVAHRLWFKHRRNSVGCLWHIRDNAEHVLLNTGDLKFPPCTDEEAIPF
jgi:hypothetical protein